MTLIDRLEAAETRSRELDCLIALATGFPDLPADCPVETLLGPCVHSSAYDTNADYLDIPEYTTSVDAALTLIPVDGFWSITAAGDGKGFDAFVRSVPNNQPMNWTRAKTAPLALVIAALRAREERA